MTTRYRRLRLATAAALAVGSLVTTASSVGATATATVTTRAVALAEGPPGGLHRQAWSLSQVTGSVEAHNLAFALSACDDCRTSAATIQIVLVGHATPPLDVVNEAGALDVGCERCEASATAHQFIAVSDGPLRLTPQGHQQLYDLQEEFERLAATPPEGGLEVIDDLAERVQATLSTELRTASPPGADPEVLQPASGTEGYQLHHEHSRRTTRPTTA